MDRAKTLENVSRVWDESITPTLVEYIKIPNKSPLFDPDWRAHGHMQKAVQLIADWCRKQPVKGMRLEVLEHPERTPLIMIDVPASDPSSKDAVLLYGHLDKQPEMTGWDEGLGPWTPVIRGDKLFGRGGADDGYSAFGALTAIAEVQRQGLPHARCVLLVEASEESGSADLPAYINDLGPKIGTPSLVICLDSGCGNYDQLWCTTSLRGVMVGTLDVQILKEGVHSGDASGIVPSSFRIARQLLSRIDDEKTGEVRIKDLHVEIPEGRRAQAVALAKLLGDEVWDKFPFVPGAKPMGNDNVERILGRTWKPTLSVTGAGGMPPIQNAGNVLRPGTQLKLSIRLPPGVDGDKAFEKVKQILEAEPPYGARISFTGEGSSGWDAPALAPWLEKANDEASKAYFGRDCAYMGEGGSIPFMAMLGEKFPEAQFLITGVLGPGSNAHGPNEFLHLPTGKRVTAVVAHVLATHASRAARS